jgi:iron complex transport system substrate-binding protein
LRIFTLFLVIALIITSGILGACKSSPAEEKSAEITVTDQIGRVVTLEKIPERIVSLAPSNTEVLYSLGLSDKIVGVSDYCDYPAEANEKEKVGGYSTSDVERIVALEPDVIFIEDFHKNEILPALENLGQTVVMIDPRSLDEVLESFTLIGEITGTSDIAAGLVKGMSDRIKAVTDKTAGLTDEQRLRVFYVMWHEPLMTVGSGTRIQELVEKAGGVNTFSDLDGYPMIDLEALVEANPQVIIAGTGMGEGADLPSTFARTEERLENTDARKNNRVYEINTDLTGRPTLRMIDALEQLAEMIHPELFD